MVDSRGEVALGGLEGVVSGEVDVQEEHTASIGGIIGAHDGGLPVVLILLVDGAGRAVGGGILAKVDKFLLDSLECHLNERLFVKLIIINFRNARLFIMQL